MAQNGSGATTAQPAGRLGQGPYGSIVFPGYGPSANHADGGHLEQSPGDSDSGADTDTGSPSDGPLKKKRRRRRSAVTGTLYLPGVEPDPDAGLDPEKLPSDDERKKNKGLEKKFPCEWPGCDKVFSRPDHLSRHRLNHEPEKIYTCDRCPKVFVRADLLTRHAERHDRREAAVAAGTSMTAANPHLKRAITTLVTPGSRPGSGKRRSPTAGPTFSNGGHASVSSTSSSTIPLPPNDLAPTAGYAQPPSGLTFPNLGAGFHAPALNVDGSAAGGPTFPAASALDFEGLTAASNGTDPGSMSNLSGFGGQAMSFDAPFLSGQDFQWLFNGSLGDAPESISWSRIGSPAPGAGMNSNNALQTSTSLLPPMQSPVTLDPTLQQSPYKRSPHLAGAGQSPMSSEGGPSSATTGVSPRTQDASETPTSLGEKKIRFEDAMTVNEATRQRIISGLKEIPDLATDPRFSIEAIGRCLELFWKNVHDSSFPILHKPTFKTSEADTLLLCTMITLGGYFTDAEGHDLATAIHEDIRKQIISSPEFRPRASLAMIQTTLLVILYGKLCSTRYHHEMAHIFWGSTLTMYRRSALFAPRGSHPPHELRNDPHAQWAAWVEDESAKRAAYTAFLIDVQHAAIFRHAPTLSAFQIQHVLPADEEEWTAPTAKAWQKLHLLSRPGVPFMSALKASLMPGLAPPFLNPFSRVVLLHGLISVAFDMQWRDVFMLGLAAPDGPVKDWRETISAAFNCWKSRLDSCLMSSPAPAHQLLRASISLYALGHIVVSIDVHELQIYAGAQKALGLVVAQQVIESTRDRVYKWALSKDGRASTWHAAHFLRSSLIHLSQSTDLLHCLHYTWACYISVLTVFSYGRALSGPPPPWEPSNTVRSVEAAMGFLDAMCTQSPDNLPAVQTKHHSLPLIAAIHDVIKTSRWEIALEGARILQRLLRSSSV